MNLDFSKILLLVRFTVLLIGLVLCIAGASIELYRQDISFMGVHIAKSEFYFISAQIDGNKLKYTDINGCDEMIIRMSVGLAVALVGIFASVIALVAVALILANLLQQLPQLLRIGALAASVSAFMGTMVSWAIIVNTSKADFCNSGTSDAGPYASLIQNKISLQAGTALLITGSVLFFIAVVVGVFSFFRDRYTQTSQSPNSLPMLSNEMRVIDTSDHPVLL